MKDAHACRGWVGLASVNRLFAGGVFEVDAKPYEAKNRMVASAPDRIYGSLKARMISGSSPAASLRNLISSGI